MENPPEVKLCTSTKDGDHRTVTVLGQSGTALGSQVDPLPGSRKQRERRFLFGTESVTAVDVAFPGKRHTVDLGAAGCLRHTHQFAGVP